MRCHGRLKGFGRFCYTWQNQESVTRRESSCEVTANHPGDTFHLAGASLHEVANVSGAQAAEAALGAGEVADLLSGFAQVLHHYYDGRPRQKLADTYHCHAAIIDADRLDDRLGPTSSVTPLLKLVREPFIIDPYERRTVSIRVNSVRERRSEYLCPDVEEGAIGNTPLASTRPEACKGLRKKEKSQI